MTRANLVVITRFGRFKFEWGSDAFPEEVREFLAKLAAMTEMPSVDWLAENNPAGSLTPGTVGNPYYYYEVDQLKHTVTMWDSRVYWVNAPDDWKERGYGCWQGKNGKYGYTSWRKGKQLERITTNKET